MTAATTNLGHTPLVENTDPGLVAYQAHTDLPYTVMRRCVCGVKFGTRVDSLKACSLLCNQKALSTQVSQVVFETTTNKSTKSTVVFSNNGDGTFETTVSGEAEFQSGIFEWYDENDAAWKGTKAIIPLAGERGLLKRMNLGGPYRRSLYRITEAKQPELIIKPTCTGCGIMAGVDCQRTCEYMFGRADVTESLPIKFNADHQFNLSINVVTDNKNFGQKKPKNFVFNSIRCAELFLMEQGYCKGSSGVIGTGERLIGFLGGTEIVKARKKRAPNKSYAARVFQKPEQTGSEARV